MDSRTLLVVANHRTLVYSASGMLIDAIDHAPYTPEYATLDQLCDQARVCDARAVWLLNGQTAAKTDSGAFWVVERPRRANTSAPAGIIVPTVARVREHYLDTSRALYVYDFGQRSQMYGELHDTRWPWWSERSPNAVIEAVLLTEAALGRQLSASPGGTGLELIAATNRKRPDWLVYEPGERPPYASDTAPRWCGVRLAYGPYTRDYKAQNAVLHLIDTNAAYLAAAQSTPLGCGALTYHESAAAGERPGVYFISGNLAAGPVIRRQGWYDWSTVRAAKLHGQPFDLAPAWLWSETHTTLRRWSETLYQLRQAVGYPREAAKAIYTAAIGLLGASTTHGGWYRQLWHAAIVAEAGRRQWWTAHNLLAVGVPVVLVDVDTIGYLWPHGEPEPPLLSGLLRDGLGGYKHTGEATVTADLLALLVSGDLQQVKARVAGRATRTRSGDHAGTTN